MSVRPGSCCQGAPRRLTFLLPCLSSALFPRCSRYVEDGVLDCGIWCDPLHSQRHSQAQSQLPGAAAASCFAVLSMPAEAPALTPFCSALPSLLVTLRSGYDWIVENGADVVEVCELQYSKATSKPARWVLAVPENSPVQSAAGLAGTIIASELVNTTKK